jgi:RNA-binding protein YhbY
LNILTIQFNLREKDLVKVEFFKNEVWELEKSYELIEDLEITLMAYTAIVSGNPYIVIGDNRYKIKSNVLDYNNFQAKVFVEESNNHKLG